MKQSNLKLIAPIYLLLGAAGAGLYRAIYAFSLDARELVIRGSIYEIALWALTAVVLLSAVVISSKTRVEAIGNPPILACLIYALGIFTLTLENAKGPVPLTMLYRIMTWAAIASLLASVLLRIFRKPHHFLLDVAPCILCILHLVECYQLWSEVPQLTDYVFGLGAILCIVLFAYHNMAFRAKLPGKRVYVFAGLAGIFFCCVAAAGTVFELYFLSTAVWMTSMFFVPRAAEA